MSMYSLTLLQVPWQWLEGRAGSKYFSEDLVSRCNTEDSHERHLQKTPNRAKYPYLGKVP
jgi:hypothetical protein